MCHEARRNKINKRSNTGKREKQDRGQGKREEARDSGEQAERQSSRELSRQR
jgi:hypothetical protein